MQFSTSSFARALAIGAASAAVAVTVGCSGSGEPPAGSTESSTSAPASAPASSDGASGNTSASGAPGTNSSGSNNSAAESNGSMIAAGRLAEKEISGGTVVSIESERDSWELQVVLAGGGEQQLRTNRSGTQVISGPTDERPDADDKAENQAFSKVKVDFAEAIETTEGEVSGAQINELNLDTENREIIWEADVSVGSQQRTVQIDANSGKVLSNRADD